MSDTEKATQQQLTLQKIFLQDASYECPQRSEEHTSELQSRPHLVCRLLLEKKKKKMITQYMVHAVPIPPTEHNLRTPSDQNHRPTTSLTATLSHAIQSHCSRCVCCELIDHR